MNNHINNGVHLCIISRNNPDILNLTIKSFYETFSKIRSLNIFTSNNNNNNYPIINTDYKCEFIKYSNKLNKNSLLNYIFNYMLSKHRIRIVIIWEGEIAYGQSSSDGWSSGDGAFLKFGSFNYNSLQLREFGLFNIYVISDINGNLIKINKSITDSSLVKIPGNYFIYDIYNVSRRTVEIIEDCPCNIYLKACNKLLAGEMLEAETLFLKRVDSNIGNEIISRSLLGIAISYKLANKPWTKIEQYLKKSIEARIDGQLEAVYFYLKWSYHKQIINPTIEYITKNKIDIFIESPPEKGLLTYDYPLYSFELLYIYIKCLFEIHKYHETILNINILLNRPDISIIIINELSSLQYNCKNRLLMIDKLCNNFKIEKNFNKYIEIEIEKNILINIEYYINEVGSHKILNNKDLLYLRRYKNISENGVYLNNNNLN